VTVVYVRCWLCSVRMFALFVFFPLHATYVLVSKPPHRTSDRTASLKRLENSGSIRIAPTCSGKERTASLIDFSPTPLPSPRPSSSSKRCVRKRRVPAMKYATSGSYVGVSKYPCYCAELGDLWRSGTNFPPFPMIL
jgi:hypothetical protein